MGRAPRSAVGNIVYHVLNRANGRMQIFRKDRDYESFEKILAEAKQKQPMRILAYCLMPNHWHLVLHPFEDGDLPWFLRWITLTHTQRWHAHYQHVGYGHLYQGRYKSFPVQEDEHFLQLVRYVERNAKRAKLVRRAEDWHWSSLYRRTFGSNEDRSLLSSWPVATGKDYLDWVNAPQPEEEIGTIRHAMERGRPYGGKIWTEKTAALLRLETTMRQRGGYRREWKYLTLPTLR